ncbi:MAG: hypothetical protein J0L64_16070 [Acidobacteria bacterium]|nr:hypothetical protein [Acidobacteriota bacterium]
MFRRYLTGCLPEAEQAALADRLLREANLSDELSEFEAEWIDARARRELSPAEAAQVDAYLAQTGQQHRLVAARRFAGATATARRSSRLPIWLAAAAAVIVGIVALRWTAPVETPPTPLATSPSPAAIPSFAVLLTPGTRSDAPRTVTLPPGTQEVEWKLALDAPLPPGEYSVRFRPAGGQDVVSRTATAPEGATSLTFRMLAGTLAPGSYRVLLAPAASPDDLVNAYTFVLRGAP